MGRTVLTQEAKQYILDNHLKQSTREIANKFGFSREVVQRFYKQNGIIIPKEVLRYFRTKNAIGKTTCTPAEDEFIRDNYLDMAPQKIANVIGGSETRVKKRIQQLGLVIPREIIEQRIIDSRRKKGDVPFNKGLKQTDYMNAEAIERTTITRFKKGIIPKNSYNEVGKITKRYDKGGKIYLHICVELGKWEMLHVYNWKQAGRDIPKGYSLWCKNGNTEDCLIENWECISRAENMRRNSMSDGAIASKLARVCTGKQGNFIDRQAKAQYLQHPSLLELKRQQLLLNRAIKEVKR